jgi:hypothetical protein
MTEPRQLIKRLEQLAADLYVALEINRIIRPAHNNEEALRRLCLYAREYYERTGGLPVYVVVYRNGAKQVYYVEDAPTELLHRAAYILRDAADDLWRRHGECRCQSVLSTLEYGCDHCVISHYVVVKRCEYCRSSRCCTYDFGVSVSII